MRTPERTQTSSLPLSGFLFGELDDVRVTDVATVTSGMWACIFLSSTVIARSRGTRIPPRQPIDGAGVNPLIRGL
jgi:hypothetical protein